MDIPKVTKFSEDGKLFLRAFLIDSSLNENSWKVVSASIPQNIKSFVGMPLILYKNSGAEGDRERVSGELDHPPYQAGHSLIYNFEWQERFKIGEIVDVVQKDAGHWDAIIEITDPLARQALESEDIPLFVSPRIIHSPDDPDDAIRNWLGAHLAAVDKPAYGDRAKISGACYGASEECKIVLKQASIKQDCGFCVKSELLKLVTNHDSSLSSSFLPSPKNIPLLMEDKPKEEETKSAQDVSVQDTECQKEVAMLKAEVAAIKALTEQSTVAVQKTADARIAAIEETYRQDKIKTLVTSRISDVKKAGEIYKNFVDAKLTPDVVEKTLTYIPTQEPQIQDNSDKFTATAEASANPRAGSFARAQEYANKIRGGSY